MSYSFSQKIKSVDATVENVVEPKSGDGEQTEVQGSNTESTPRSISEKVRALQRSTEATVDNSSTSSASASGVGAGGGFVQNFTPAQRVRLRMQVPATNASNCADAMGAQGVSAFLNVTEERKNKPQEAELSVSQSEQVGHIWEEQDSMRRYLRDCI